MDAQHYVIPRFNVTWQRLATAVIVAYGAFLVGERIAGPPSIKAKRERVSDLPRLRASILPSKQQNQDIPKKNTSDELITALKQIEQNADSGERVMDMIRFINHWDAEDCISVLSTGKGFLPYMAKDYIVAKLMSIDPDKVMDLFPKGEYLDFLAMRDPLKATEWAKQKIAIESSSSNIRDISERLASGLASQDPKIVFKDFGPNLELRAIDVLSCVAARGVDYALEWQKCADMKSQNLYGNDLFYSLAQNQSDLLLDRLADVKNISILKNYSDVIVAGIASKNPTKALSWLTKQSDFPNERILREVTDIISMKSQKNLFAWARAFPDEDAYRSMRIDIASKISYEEGLNLLNIHHDEASSKAFSVLLDKWKEEEPEKVVLWLENNHR